MPMLPVLVSTYNWFVLTAKSPVVERLMLKPVPAAGVIVRAADAVTTAAGIVSVVPSNVRFALDVRFVPFM